jgi:ribosomal protein S18 acetylase RimI-like enzyme
LKNQFSPPLIIKRACRNDLDAILNIWIEAIHWVRAKLGMDPNLPVYFNDEIVLQHYEDTELYIALLQNTIVGTFSIQWSDNSIWKQSENEAAGYIHKVVVPREFSGKRIGKLLLDWSEKYIKENGKDYSRLDCMTENQNLNSYYQNHGYILKGYYEENNYKASLYEKRL